MPALRGEDFPLQSDAGGTLGATATVRPSLTEGAKILGFQIGSVYVPRARGGTDMGRYLYSGDRWGHKLKSSKSNPAGVSFALSSH